MILRSTPHGSIPAEERTLLKIDCIDAWLSLFERSTLGFALVDSEFRFLKANPAFLTMFGYSNEELQQLSFLDICIDEALDQCRDQTKKTKPADTMAPAANPPAAPKQQ
jgi:PAS domain-containing protein